MHRAALALSLFLNAFAPGLAARASGDVFTVECGGRMYHFAHGRVVGVSEVQTAFTVDLSRMVWARTTRLDEQSSVRRVRGDWIFLTSDDPAESRATIYEALNRKSLKYEKTVEFLPFREEISARCKTVTLVPLG